jgi:tetratricopeptide (TPR) repeat protein
MSAAPHATELAVIGAFYTLVIADRAAGTERTLAEYQARFPGFEDVIARARATLDDGDGPEESAASILEPPLPASLGHYAILREIGRGGQGEVLLAEDQRLRRLVALKLLRSWGPGAGARLQRFEREARVASRLDHPGICTIYGSGIANGVPYIAMRFVEGTSLGSVLASAPGVPHADEVIRRSLIVEQVARAIHVAHEAGIVHRDLKPANVMVTPSEEPVVLDFGLARDLDGVEGSLTATGDSFGTPAYMAPEQIDGNLARPDRRCDVWALGVILYEAVTGSRPFAGVTRESLHRAILTGAPPDPRSINRAVSRDLAAIVAMALEKNRDRRYRTALDLADDLGRLRAGKFVRARLPGVAERSARWIRREPAKASAAFLAFAAAGLAGYLVARGPDLRAHREAVRKASVERELESGFEEGSPEGRPDLALAAFERARALDPDSVGAAAGTALVLLDLRRHDDAQTFLAGHPALLARHPSLRWIEAQALRDAGRRDDADALERQLGEPEDPLALFIAGSRDMVLANRGDGAAYSRAAARFRRCIMRASPARSIYHFAYAVAAGFVGEPAMARDAATAVRHLWPQSPNALAAAGAALAKVDPASATRLLEEAAEKLPGNLRILAHLARARLAANDGAGVRDASSRMIALDPRSYVAWFYEGIGLGMVGSSASAIDAFRQSLALAPAQPMTLFNLAKALAAAGKIDEAIATNRQALALEPRLTGAAWNLGRLLASRGQADAALRAFEDGILAAPDDAGLRHNYAHVARQLGRLDVAEQALRELIRREPGHAVAHNDLGGLLAAHRRRAEAQAEFERAIAIAPDFADAHYNLGLMLQADGRKEAAAAAFARFVDLAAPEARTGGSRPGEDPGTLARELMTVVRLSDGREKIEAAERPLELAALARRAGLFATAARLISHAVREELVDADERHAVMRELARTAGLAAEGRGPEAARLSPSERESFRAQALEALENLGEAQSVAGSRPAR